MIEPWRQGRFSRFAAIDWSGAAGERQGGIAVAVCADGDTAPALVRRGHRWSRQDVADWLTRDMPADTLVGIDLGMSLPFADAGAFFPDWPDSPNDAKALWAMVDRLAGDDPHLSVGSVVDHEQVSRYFRRHGNRLGDRFGPAPRGRLRVTEWAQARQGCRPYSNFNLVGAAQVGKSSLTGMRVLHGLDGRVAVWPFDPLPATGSVLLEIYTSIAAMAAGRSPGASKMRDHQALNHALFMLGSAPVPGVGSLSDHASDALLTAAWLRHACRDPALWHPDGIDAVRHTEGWTFGAR